MHAPRFAPLDADPDKKISGEVCTLTHTCDKGDVQAEDAEQIAALHPIRSRCRPAPVQRLPDPDQEEEGPHRAVCARAGGAEHSGRGERRRGLRRLARGRRRSRCCCARWPIPQDPLSLIAVLRGPLFGISDPELFAFKQSGGWFSVFQDPDAPGQPDGPVSAALAALNRYYRWTRVLPAAGALERILEDSGYLALAATTPGGVDAGDVVHAVDRVRQVVETGGSLADAADALEADREATSEVESLPLEPGRTDVVRLDEPAQGQGARGQRGVSGRSARRRQAAGRCAHRAGGAEGARVAEARSQERDVVRRDAARRARRLGRARSRRTAVLAG